MDPEITERLVAWAKPHNSVIAIWLFGSRARGDHRQDSDFDIALELAPKKGLHDWALGTYIFEWKMWKAEIKAIIGAEVSLIGFRDDIEGKFDPRAEGLRLWLREPR